MYELIKRERYVIDVRGVYPILIKGLWARKFNTFEDAINYAMRKIRFIKEVN